MKGFGTALENPFHIVWCDKSLKTLLIFLMLYGLGIGIYVSNERVYRRREEQGSARWGNPLSIAKRYQQSGNANKLLTQQVALGLDGRNVALPDDFDKLLATMRSREISVSIILQNLAQLKALFDKQWESIVGNCDTFLYLGGNEQSTHEYVSKLLGKQTIDTNTYGQSKGRSGSYTTNFQTAGRELMTPDEVRMLDNRYVLLFIRGERPVKDLKYNILKHPNVALTTDGKAAAYQHGTDPLSVAAVSINLEKLKQAIPEDTDTGDYVVLTEEEVYDFMRKKAQENNKNQNSNYQEVTYEKHHPQHHSSHHPSDF